jgi:hypothetical protein
MDNGQRAKVAADASRFDVKAVAMADNAQQPRITLNLTASQARLLAEAIRHGAPGVEAPGGHLQDLEKQLRAFADRPREYVEERTPTDQERYERLLRATARLRYPERTPALEAKIEKAIQKRLGEFGQEQQLRAYEASLRREVAARHPNLTVEAAERYERKIKALVEEQKQKLEGQKHPLQPARSQQQDRGYELER